MADPLIRDLLPGDAAALSALFERCYGRSYGTPVFYDVPALASLIESGGLRSVVAADGECLCGHTGIRIHDQAARICETGNTVVDPESRGQGLLRKLGGALRDRVVREGFSGYVHYPTTAHEIMQRASVSNGGSETGLMLGYIAETTEYKAVVQRPGRLAATVAFQPLGPLPERTVRAPERYRELMARIYQAARLERRFDDTGSDPLPAGFAEVGSALHSDRGVLSLRLGRSGSDLTSAVGGLIRAHQPAVTHLDLSLDEPCTGAVAEALNDLGFIFCAVLPEFRGTDVLRLQRLQNPRPRDFEADLVNAGALDLCRFMQEEAALV